jgi:hypothetical protein
MVGQWEHPMKTKVSLLFLLIACGLVRTHASAKDSWKSYIGKSNCSPELSSPINRYGVRLDRTQKAYVIVYKFKDSEIATIVQYQDDSQTDRSRCGVVRDVAQVQDEDSSVVWECSDRRTPAAVVIGTWPATHSKPFGAARQAWRVDLKELKFVPIESAPKFVYCRPEHGRGNDEGDGLSDWVRKQARKHASN